ncbi:DUF2750 domain-containing protein [Marinomonas sp. M1K-6]|uniref:DUF2750 domain-containing protein n=1 Tax=Marinomonas profundi TaxID=2726122 RepID=A0A847R7C9_9GAMM|nr:DUF2750 domain-containing protein [Marinomonas profundi]NLQ16170.1 DUF2750 domain-containing protein [Marinomonas profundi]UDV03246.1 DUF2750 domain-containing protein [Marinomonas profundi]
MSNTPSSQDTFYRHTSSERDDLMLKHLKKGESIWTLADTEGCLIIDLGSDKVLPIWPSEALATAWAEKDYPEFTSLEIHAADWAEKWLPGMQNDGFSVGVAPNLAGECIVSSAEEHAADLQR